MKENLKKIMEKYEEFMYKPTTIIMVIWIVLLSVFPLKIQFRNRVRDVEKRVEQLEEQIKVIEVQKNETSN